MHTDAAEGEDLQTHRAKREIMREDRGFMRVLQGLTGQWNGRSVHVHSKPRYALAFWHAWQPLTWLRKPGECVCVRVCVCAAVHVRDDMKKER